MGNPPKYFQQLVEAQISIARLEESFEAMSREMGEMKQAHRGLNEKMDLVLTTLSEARGGWRTLVWIGTSCATLGAGLAWVVEQLLRRS